MVRFRTQAEVLKYLGKDTNQRVYISRMIKKGLIEKESWWYTVKEQATTHSVTTVTSECNNNVTPVTQWSEYIYTQDDMDYVNKIIEGQDVEIRELQGIILKIYNRLWKTYSWQDFKTSFWITFTVEWENE
jgi:hypothetical protein